MHKEMGKHIDQDKVMGKISEELWNTIRTGDGIQTEITQTVQSVYNKLLNPQLNEAGESSSHSDLQPTENGVEINGHIAASSVDAEPSEPPGFARLGTAKVTIRKRPKRNREFLFLPSQRPIAHLTLWCPTVWMSVRHLALL
ncbi:hypothetical protein K7X08_027634 [Anisodus acutangulus]|uniref:Uncharacterized protein n=1 Tax=Anisodus acutangulus TaxID=402998 RepID=A0A9Q1MN74_9SOLA|nr:hypothetical protein K7X08_027634 [Anisodus acutangulus]